MRNSEIKKQAIRDAIEYLKKCPNGKRERKRKPFLRAKHLENSKVFFDIFIPKVLQGNLNDQYRRLKDLPEILRNMFFISPQKNKDSYIFVYNGYTSVVVKKEKIKKGKIHVEHYLLLFSPI